MGETLQSYAIFFKERYVFRKKRFNLCAKFRKKARACNSTDKIGSPAGYALAFHEKKFGFFLVFCEDIRNFATVVSITSPNDE